VFVTALWLQCPGVRERESVLFVAVCLMKVSVEQCGDKEGRAEQVKLSVCVIQHRAPEVYALVKIHLDAFDHEVSYRHALTALPLGNRRPAEPHRPPVLCWPNVGWDFPGCAWKGKAQPQRTSVMLPRADAEDLSNAF
jgi:hypothetical protein